jgi:hypothetical protein
VWAALIVGILVLVVLLIFILQNMEDATIHFMGLDALALLLELAHATVHGEQSHRADQGHDQGAGDRACAGRGRRRAEACGRRRKRLSVSDRADVVVIVHPARDGSRRTVAPSRPGP